MADSEAGPKAQAPFNLRMAKALADPLRIKILLELSSRDMSPKQFFEAFGGESISRVSRHFEVLSKYGWLKLVGKKSGGKRRGAVEHFYRATGPVLFDENTWPSLPEPMKNLVTWNAFETLAEQVNAAIKAGTIDARDDRHVSWIPLRLDQRGWEKVIGKLDALFHFLLEEQEKANLRLAKSGEEPIPMTVALAGFESPKDSTKAP